MYEKIGRGEKMNHIHSYKKIRGRPGFYMCASPDCSHYKEKALLLGKKATCPKCGDVFIMDREDLTYATVVCKCCHDGPRAEKLRKIREAIKSFAGNLNETTITRETMLRDEYESSGIRKKISFSPVTEEEEILEAIGSEESIGMKEEQQ